MRRTLTLLLILQLTALSTTALANSEECERHYSNTDYETAFDYCVDAAEYGDSNAQQNVALMYTFGWGTRADDAKAFEYYKMAADNGVVNAQLTVGNRYNNGDGVPQNYAKAEEYWLQAASNGNVYAQTALGQIYTDGKKTEQDLDSALEWYKKASESGLYFALVNIARVFNEGIVVPRNTMLSHAYYNLAATTPYDTQVDFAREKRRELEEEMTVTELSKAQELASECLEREYKNCFLTSEVLKR
jgi:TPR repeat protein